MANQVILVGRVGKDPTLKRIGSKNTACVNLSVATTERFKGESKTDWHNVVVYGKTAEAVEKYVSKGDQIFIEGRLQTRSYDKNGSKHYVTEVIANRVEFLGGNSGGGKSGGGNPDAGVPNESDDDIPF